jgi:hypothetical protein
MELSKYGIKEFKPSGRMRRYDMKSKEAPFRFGLFGCLV